MMDMVRLRFNDIQKSNGCVRQMNQYGREMAQIIGMKLFT